MNKKYNVSSKKQMIEEQLLELIRNNNLSGGDKLPSERELATTLNVSRNVLREAIVVLSANGIIEVRERMGIFVKNTIDSLNSLQLMPADFMSYQLEVRTIIEVPAVRLAAQRRTDNDIRKLYECYENFNACPYETTEDQSQSGKWEALLHHFYTESAHNPILSRINESIHALVERNNLFLHPMLLMEENWMDHIKEQHRTIVKAIESRDSRLAGNILETHMIESVQIIAAKHPDRITKLFMPYWSL